MKSNLPSTGGGESPLASEEPIDFAAKRVTLSGQEIQDALIRAAKKCWPGKPGFWGWSPGIPDKYRNIYAVYIHRATQELLATPPSSTSPQKEV